MGCCFYKNDPVCWLLSLHTQERIRKIIPTICTPGNYNEKTSELYTDLSFITTRQEIGEEASAVFNNMALQRLTSEADTMLVAPLRFKSVLLEQMDRQIDRARRGLPASMILKNNSINDPQIINKISEASCAGVRVDMIVRGICCIKAGVPGKTENVHIRSIVGRYLEHSRIYCFGEGEDMTIYIASGDFLTRNTERRVEVGVRVDDREIAKKLRGILDLQLRDTVNAREMQPDGIYTRVKPKQGEPPVVQLSEERQVRCWLYADAAEKKEG